MSDDVEVRVGAQTEGLEAGMHKAASVVQEAVSAMQNSTGLLGAVIGGVSGVVQELTNQVLTGLGNAIKRTVAEYGNAAEEIRMLSTVVGGSNKELSVLRATFDDIGISTQEYLGIIQRMTMQLRSNEERFTRMGVTTRDAEGKLLSMNQIFRNTIDTLKDYKEGTDRNLASSELLGRSWQSLGKIIRLNDELLEDSAKTAEEFGLVMTQQDVAAAREFELTINDLGDAFSGMFVSIGRMLIPILTDLGQILRDVLPAAWTVLKGSMAGVLSLLSYLRLGIITLWELMIGFGNAVVTYLVAPFKALAAAVRGDFSGAAGALKNAYVQAGAEVEGAIARIGKQAEKTNKYVHDLFLGDGSADAEKTGFKEYEGKGKKDKTTKDKGDFDEWKKELQAKKDASDVFRGMELEAERAFWESKLAKVRAGTQDEAKVRHELAQLNKKDAQQQLQEAISALDQRKEELSKHKGEVLKIEEAKVALLKTVYGADSKQYRDALREKLRAEREYQEERKQIELQAVEHQREIHRIGIERVKEDLDFQRDIGLITNEQRINSMRELYEIEHQMAREHLQQKLALEEEGTLQHQQILNQMELMDQQYFLQVQKLQQQQAMETGKLWGDVLGTVTSAIETSVKGIILGTTTMQKALSNIWTAILGEFISFLAKKLAAWMKTLTLETIFQKSETAARTAAEMTAAAAEAAAVKGKAMAEIAAYAGTAGAAATASAAAIPYTGWMIAPAAGAAAFAAAMSYQAAAAGVGFAVGSWKVPDDMVTKVHKGETIMPAEFAEKFREGDGAAGGGGGGKGDTYVIQAMDPRSFRDFVRRNASELGPGMRRAARNFSPATITGAPTGKVY